MYIIETERLKLLTKCTVLNGEFTYYESGNIDILNLNKDVNCNGFLIRDKNDQNIGHITVLFKREPYELSVGVKEEYREKGYMKEALGACIEWIFNNCNTDFVTGLKGAIVPEASEKLLNYYHFIRKPEAHYDCRVLYKDVFFSFYHK